MFLNSGIGTRSSRCAVKKFELIFRLSYLSSAMFVPIKVICDLHNFLPCSSPDFYKSCWGAAELQPYWSVDYPEWQYARHCLSLINLTLLFPTKHRMSQEEKLCLDFATYTEMTLLRKTPIHTQKPQKHRAVFICVCI